jgi:hypothetical protein
MLANEVELEGGTGARNKFRRVVPSLYYFIAELAITTRRKVVMKLLVECCRFFHAIFVTKKRNCYFKTNKTSNSMTKETTTFLLAVVASLVELIQRWNHLVSPGNETIGGMLSLLPCHFRDQKTKLLF